MAKAKIINVNIDSKINTVYVTYSTGTEKLYPANKLPKTVQAWMEEHQEETEEAVEEVKEAVEGVVEAGTQVDTQVDTQVSEPPAVTQKSELTVPVEAEIVKDNSMGAAEAVAFGVMMAMAVTFWGIVGLAQILMAGIEVLWTLARPRVVRFARATVRSLPTVTTKKGLAVAIRVLQVLVGIMTLM